jgi:hypothetical protein
MGTLEKEFAYYLKNQKDLVKQHNGKYIVIIGETVVGAYNTEAEALFTTQKSYKLGTFLIQKCTPGKEAYTQTFYSRVAFA